MATDPSVKKATPSQDSTSKPLKKRYTFNETGNIMISTVEEDGGQISETFRNICSEVGVFFAAMNKAIASVINPNTQQPYSLYNYNALKSVIDHSGMFIHLNEEQIEHNSAQVGQTFSTELIQSLIGIDVGAAYLKFATAMVRSVGKEALALCNQANQSESEAANIIFVCESLMGAPLVSAIIIRLDVQIKTNLVGIKAKPCHRSPSPRKVVTSQWVFHKDTYLFVPPEFIKRYASALNESNTAAYQEFIQNLTNKLGQLHDVGT